MIISFDMLNVKHCLLTPLLHLPPSLPHITLHGKPTHCQTAAANSIVVLESCEFTEDTRLID